MGISLISLGSEAKCWIIFFKGVFTHFLRQDLENTLGNVTLRKCLRADHEIVDTVFSPPLLYMQKSQFNFKNSINHIFNSGIMGMP